MKHSPAQLLSSLAAGNSPAWEQLCSILYDDSIHAALRVSGSRDIAEDAVQEALLVVKRKAGNFHVPEKNRHNPDTAARAWVRGIVIKCCLHLMRSRRNCRRREQAPQVPQAKQPLDPADLACSRDLIRNCLAQLPPHLARAVCLRFMLGYSYAEIASSEACSQVNARVRCSRGLARLRRWCSTSGLTISLSCLATELHVLHAEADLAQIVSAKLQADLTSQSITNLIPSGAFSTMTLALSTVTLGLVTLASFGFSDHIAAAEVAAEEKTEGKIESIAEEKAEKKSSTKKSTNTPHPQNTAKENAESNKAAKRSPKSEPEAAKKHDQANNANKPSQRDRKPEIQPEDAMAAGLKLMAKARQMPATKERDMTYQMAKQHFDSAMDLFKKRGMTAMQTQANQYRYACIKSIR